MAIDKVKIAAELRKTATALREEARTHEETQLQKCAQVLLAARGLSALQRIIQGANHVNN